MCGWAAVISKSGALQNATKLLDELEDRLRHRGPDEHGRFVAQGFAVVHRRLSIVDIVDGQQPMQTEDGRVGIVFNGEVYNFKELRRELEAKGHGFKTRCDTEVILRAFVEFGPEAFERLDGMFTVFVWDFRKDPSGEFHVARDHLGTKPLYAYEDGVNIILSSELRPILALPGVDGSLLPEGILSYLTFRYVQSPMTIFRYISRVEAGTRWQIRSGRITKWRYWDLPQVDVPINRTEEEAAEIVYFLLKESVRSQQMGEVPIGLLLSGGLDSTAIACICHELGAHYRTFNIGFPDVNEFEYSNAVARMFGQSHDVFETSLDEMVSIFPKVSDAMDEPIGDPACFPLYVLCGYVKQHVTVLISGEGSDEIFGGYPQYAQLLNGQFVDQDASFNAFLKQSWYFPGSERAINIPTSSSRLLRHISYFAERELLGGMLAYDLKTWLPENLLMKADKISMSHSLEGRFPFLSRRLVEFAMNLPTSVKLRDGVGKQVLRRAFAKKIPESVLTRPKMGFSVPLPQLLYALRDCLKDLISATRKTELGAVLDMEYLESVSEDHFTGRRENTLWLWAALVLMQWYHGQFGSRIRDLSSGNSILRCTNINVGRAN
jgi:asparagine synthase (glutamine-hydrolysing)